MEISPAKRGHDGQNFFKGDRPPAAYYPVNTLLLRQAAQGTGEEFFLNGQRMETVKLTCRISEIREGGQRYDLTFADEFGGFKGVIYRSSKGVQKSLRNFSLQTYQPSDYVSVIGHLRRFQDNTVMMVDLLEEVQGYDEVMEHRAKVVWSWALRCGKSSASPKAEVLKERAPVSENRDEFAHMPAIQQDILRTVKRLMEVRNSPAGGISKSDIFKELRSKVMDKEFESTLQSLVLYGYLMDADRDCYVPAT